MAQGNGTDTSAATPGVDNEIGALEIAEDFGKSLVQGAVISPLWNGLGGAVSLGYLPQVSIVNTDNASKSEIDRYAQELGGGLGVALDIGLLLKGKGALFGGAIETRAAAGSVLGKQSLFMQSIFKATEGAQVGAVYGAVFTPSDPNESLLWGRIKNAGSDAITFGAMNGLSHTLGNFGLLAKVNRGFAGGIKDMAVNGLAGLPGGALGAETSSLLNTGSFADIDDVRAQALDMGVIGMALPGVIRGLGALSPKPSLAGTVAESKGVDYGKRIDQKSSLTAKEQELDLMPLDTFPGTTFETQGKHIPLIPTALEVKKLELPWTSSRTGHADTTYAIKRYIDINAQEPVEYFGRVVKNNSITIIGEEHRMDFLHNPHHAMGIELMKTLPRGSALAVEMPASLKPIFDDFNSQPAGSSFDFSSPAAKMLSLQPELGLLRTLETVDPLLLEMWKTARDRKVRVVPIDVDLNANSNFLTDVHREKFLADQLLALHEQNQTAPVVAWMGNAHAGRSNFGDAPMLAKQIAASPKFADGTFTLSTVLSQICGTPIDAPLRVLAGKLDAAAALPVPQSGYGKALSKLWMNNRNNAYSWNLFHKVGDFDHVVLYPEYVDTAKTLGLADLYLQTPPAASPARPRTSPLPSPVDVRRLVEESISQSRELGLDLGGTARGAE